MAANRRYAGESMKAFKARMEKKGTARTKANAAAKKRATKKR